TSARLDEMRNGREKADREVAQLRAELAEAAKSQHAAREQLATRLNILEAENRELITQRDMLTGQTEQARAYGQPDRHSPKNVPDAGEREFEASEVSPPRTATGLKVISMTELAKVDARQDLASRD